MSKTKAVIAAELAAAKRTIADMKDAIMDLRDEATGWHQRAKTLEDQLAAAVAENIAAANAKVDRMGDNKPWKLAALAFAVGIVIGWIARVAF